MSNEKQQTAVDSIKTTFFHYAEPYPYFSEDDKWVITKQELFELLEEAKEMEKEQIIKSYNEDLYGGLSNHKKFDDGENYYNETYGGNK